LDPELQDFLQRAEFLVRRFLTVAPSQDTLEAAIDGGEDAFLRLLEVDPTEGQREFLQLKRDAQRLSRRHPVLEAQVLEFERRGAPPCDTWELSQLARRLQVDASLSVLSVGKETRVVCEQVQYVSALLLCAATGNTLFYVACAVMAMCNYCSGGLVNSICGG